MGGYNDLKTAIAALIHTNDNQEITGATLQSALLSIINTIGQGSVFKGVATTSTNPGSPDANVFYIAGRPGYYPNFNLELTAGLHVIENKSGTWVNTEIALDVVDAINIGSAKHVKPSQAMIIALQSVEQIPDSEGRNNAMWWSTDGNLKYKQNDTVYNLGAPAYVLYYCGDKIYKWTGSGFREIGGGGTFASGEAVSNMSIFDDGSDTDGKSSAQLAAMIPSGEVIKSLLEIISSIDTSGGSYDGVDLITTFSYDAPTRVITVKQSGRQAKTILLPLANSTNAGLMSSEDKTRLANIQNLIGRTVNSFSKSTGETGITITLVTSDSTPYAVLIPIDSELSSESTSNLVTGAAIYNFLTEGFVYLDQDKKAYAPYTRILPLVSMGSVLDNGHTPAQIRAEEFYYEPSSKRIYRYNTITDQPYFMPSTSQLYLNICTGKMYKWTGSDMEEISGGVDPVTLAGKADKHVTADMLTPSQWPHVMIYNIESMWGAGGTPPDYASIPVGSIYLDDSDGGISDPPYRRLFYKKTLEGTSQRIDLGAPQENTIYCHIATGKLYRWIPTQNGNDGAFQQIGGSGTVKTVSVNSGTQVQPDVQGNVNVILPIDDAPGNTDNLVKSRGIQQAIDEKLSQVTVNAIPAGSVAIVDDVVTDDPEQVLSARQGKRLANSIAGLGLEAHEANGTLFISRVADNRSVPPTISYTETSTTITVTAAGVGTITLYRGGTEAANVVSNPITINKTSTTSVVRFYATAQQTGKTVSEMASLAVTIPAYVAPNPRLTSPANNSSVNITRTASLVSTALSAQSGSPVTIPSGVASQSVAVTVNAPTEVIDFDNMLTDATKNDTFPFQMPASNSPWIRWKKAVDNGYSSSNIILVIGKLTSDCPAATLKCYKDSNTSHMIFIEDANGNMVSAGAGVAQATVDSGKWFAGWFYGSASNSTQTIYFLGTATYEYCYAINYSAEKISGDTIANFVQRYAKLPLTIHNASYSNAGSQDLTVTHNGTDTVISNITTGATITVEAGDTVSISSGSVNFSVDVTTYTAGTATVVVKGADLSQPISIAVSGTGFTCDTVSVTATDANSTNGKNVVVTYDASGSNTGALTLTSSEFNTVSVTLNGTNT